MQDQTLIPSQLFVGPQKIIENETELLLQKHFCKNKTTQSINSCYCSGCRKVKQHQHESIIWINPEKDYTVKDIDIIFEKIKFALDENQKYFFILQKTQTLNLATANKLLKVLEEPSPGYNFILHTNNLNSIIPTIVSRSHIVNFINNVDPIEENNPITSFFYKQDLDNPIEFDKQLKSVSPSDSQSIELINQMLKFYAKQIINSYKENSDPNKQIKHLEKILKFIKEKLKKPPQSGSSKLFWKNVYISFPRK